MRVLDVKIYQRGGRKNHKFIHDAARFFAEHLFQSHTAYVQIKIMLKHKGLRADEWGTCVSYPDDAKQPAIFEVVIKKDIELLDQVQTLAHEMIHIKQRLTGALKFKRTPRGKIHVFWHDVDLGHKRLIPYGDRPWEHEAEQKEQRLLDAFLKNYPD